MSQAVFRAVSAGGYVDVPKRVKPVKPVKRAAATPYDPVKAALSSPVVAREFSERDLRLLDAGTIEQLVDLAVRDLTFRANARKVGGRAVSSPPCSYGLDEDGQVLAVARSLIAAAKQRESVPADPFLATKGTTSPAVALQAASAGDYTPPCSYGLDK